MSARSILRSTIRWTAAGAGLAAAAYATSAAVTWARYGYPRPPTAEEVDPLLDRFMPIYDVVERHHVDVAAPAAVTLAAAKAVDMYDSAIVRAIVKTRALVLGAEPDDRARRPGLLEEMRSIGWGVLAETAQETICGAVTRPWEANVRFRALPPDQFASFDEPGYVKIAWTLRADAVSNTASIFRTETRVLPTDATARARFRRYWAFISPGTLVIRQMLLSPIKSAAEHTHERFSTGVLH
jgi:hypothetical protein